MDDKKDTVLLFTSIKEPVSAMTDEEAGKLFKAILAYQTGEDVNLEGLMNVVFLQIKQQIDYANIRYAEISKKRSEARKKKLEEKQNETNDNKSEQNTTKENKSEQTETNRSYNDNENGNENVNVNENNINVIQNKKTHTYACKAVVTAFNDLCVSFPRVQSLTETRKRYIKILLGKYTLDEVKEVFRKAEATDFLKGAGDHGWKANFDWIIKEGNFLKVKEGNYDKQRKHTDPPKPEPIDTYDLPDFVARAEDY